MKLGFPKLNQKQLEKLSDIFSDIALVSLASVILPAVFDKHNLVMIQLGSIITIVFWIVSIWFRK